MSAPSSTPVPGELDTVILCGGRGTRAQPDTVQVPKPLLEVGGRPMVDQVMDIYRSQGCTRFVLASGYRHELFEQLYGANRVAGVTVVDTGIDTDKAERLRRARPACSGERIFVTYGDGLGDIDLAALLDFHLRSGAAATVTTVPLPSPYGTLDTDETGRVRRFREKPQLLDHWINAGFFVLELEALARAAGPNLERDVLPALAADGVLYAYRHTGFWKSMDTFKDRQELNRLATASPPPWRPRIPGAG